MRINPYQRMHSTNVWCNTQVTLSTMIKYSLRYTITNTGHSAMYLQLINLSNESHKLNSMTDHITRHPHEYQLISGAGRAGEKTQSTLIRSPDQLRVSLKCECSFANTFRFSKLSCANVSSIQINPISLTMPSISKKQSRQFYIHESSGIIFSTIRRTFPPLVAFLASQ